MRRSLLCLILALLTHVTPVSAQATREASNTANLGRSIIVQLGPRPFFLVNDMADSPLKQRLQQCAARRST